ncbi:hypothetical protein Zmor_005146 [Zophobas morio]|uniref:Uncharacterized protein n=1 Tax=Zophobas morio TaxID=2755281 RepID=A0AA38ISW2_9CUCU|nr:hypothetical protein Zmor_005146 [Zophobas morio]
MRLPNVELSVKNVAAALTIIQGLAWTIMSLICIILFHSQPEFLSEPTSYMESVGRGIYLMFLSKASGPFPGKTFTFDVFAGFMWFYFFLDILWIGTAVYMLWKDSAKTVMVWSYVTLFVCLWDFITFVILGVDYDKCLEYSNTIEWTDVITLKSRCAYSVLHCGKGIYLVDC